MTLSTAQSVALTAFQKFLEQPVEPVFLLRGYAGTGKTFLLKALLADLAARGRRAVLLAPTGRAARVMAQQASRDDAATIHRGIYDFRHLKPLQEGKTDAEKSFKYYFALAANQHPKGTVFVVDEASMIGDAYSESEFFRLGSGHLLRDLLEYVAPTPANGYKLLLVGDRAQLPPVGDADSWALDAGWLGERLGRTTLPEIELTEVMRQAAGSGILDNATVVREALRCKQFAGLKLTPGDDVRQLQAGELLTTYLAAGGSPRALGKAIIVTYSNNRANFYNAQVRRHFFGADMREEFPAQPPLQVGDRLMVTQNNYLDRQQPIYNGDFALVQQVGQPYSRQQTVRMNKTALQVTLTWRPVRLKLRGADGQSYEVERLLLEDFLTSADNSLRAEQVKALYIDAVIRWRTKTGHDEKHPEFNLFLQADREFHALRAKYGYAITCHKAQGGTWETAFVDFSGHSGQAHAHYFRWVYTALTRASKMLYLLSEGSFTPWEKMRVFDPHATPPTPGGVPLWPEVKRALTASFDPLEELEARLGITKRPVAQQQQFRRVATQLREVGAEVEAVSDQQHALRYSVRRGNVRGEVLAYYKQDVPLSNAQPTGQRNALTMEAVAKLNEPLPTSTVIVPVTFGPELPPTLETFYEAFAEAAAQQDITIMAIQHNAYCERYLLADNTGLAEMLVDYDGKGRLKGARLNKHDSPELVHRVHQLLHTITH